MLKPKITPRQPSFTLDELEAVDLNRGDPFRNAFFNALSVTFPLGEKFFIDSVRAFSEEVTDQTLRTEIRRFVRQEAVHRGEHQKYNERVSELRKYDLRRMEDRWRKRIRWTEDNISPFQRLAATVAFEHLTALLADGVLRNPSWFEGVDRRIVSLWNWHAVEETEHKALAFDVYRAVGGDDSRRRMMLKIVTLILARDVMRNTYAILKTERKHLSARVWWSGIRFLFGRDGLVSGAFRNWRAFGQSDFHPWKTDNRQLIEDWSTRPSLTE